MKTKMQNAAVVKSLAQQGKMLCLPSAGGNPYQTLLYSQNPAHNHIAFAGPGGLDRLDEGGFDQVHLHWDDRMFGRSNDPEANEADLDTALQRLTRFKLAGGRIVWTIHNDSPHKARGIETFQRARQQLTVLADAIHVHAPHAADHMADTYDAPRHKLHVIPHPSYLGAYEPGTRTLTRSLPKAETRQFLFFGMFRGPKGIHSIRDAVGKLTKRQVPYHLKMYGKAFSSQARLLRILEMNPKVDLRTDRIPDTEIPDIFGTSQVFLAPYQALFTSGSIMLALTFGLPVIGPNIREMRETLPEACHHLLYDPNAPRGLIKSMLQFVEMPEAELQSARDACFAFAKERSPQKIGREVNRLLGTTRRAKTRAPLEAKRSSA